MNKTPNDLVNYAIVAVPFHADAATHDELSRKVNEKLRNGYQLHGTPFIGGEMMYQAMTKPSLPGSVSNKTQSHSQPSDESKNLK
jgi:hypothetical protein